MKPKCCGDKSGREDIAQTVAILKLLSEESRLKIICILKSKEHCACKIIEHLGLPQNLVSHHLKKLKAADLIQGRKNGTWIYYSLTGKGKKVARNVFKLN